MGFETVQESTRAPTRTRFGAPRGRPTVQAERGSPASTSRSGIDQTGGPTTPAAKEWTRTSTTTKRDEELVPPATSRARAIAWVVLVVDLVEVAEDLTRAGTADVR